MWFWGEIRFLDCICHLFSGGQSQGNKQAFVVAYALLWCTSVYFLLLIPSVGFILFCSQLRKEFEKCQKLFYKIILYIAPFCSVFQIVSNIVHLYQQSYDLSNFLKHTWYVSICHYALLLSLLPIISTVRSGIITKHIRENGNVRKNILLQKLIRMGQFFLLLK